MRQAELLLVTCKSVRGMTWLMGVEQVLAPDIHPRRITSRKLFVIHSTT